MGLLRTCIAKVMPVNASEYGPPVDRGVISAGAVGSFPVQKPAACVLIMLGTESAVDVENSSISITRGFEYAITSPDASVAGVRVRGRTERQGPGDQPAFPVRREHLVEGLLVLVDHVRRSVARPGGDQRIIEAKDTGPEWPQREARRLERVGNQPPHQFLAQAEIAAGIAHLVDESIRRCWLA